MNDLVVTNNVENTLELLDKIPLELLNNYMQSKMNKHIARNYLILKTLF